MDKKIIFLDLDGTLTNDEKKVTEKTRNALWKIMEEGHVVALASGRPTLGMRSVADALELQTRGGYLLSFNGGKITDDRTGEIMYQNAVPRELVPELIAYAKAHNLGAITYDDKGILVGTRMDSYIEEEQRINQIPIAEADLEAGIDFDPIKLLMTAEPEVAERCAEELGELFKGKLTVGRSAPYFIEIVANGIDKATAIDHLIQRLGIPREHTVACGDGYNDLSMVQYAHVGVAMENAVDIIREHADYITASNNADGIAQVIEEFF